jgi:hypothetical protein
VSLDTNWDPAGTWDGGLRESIGQVDLFFPNENEALAITHRDTLHEALEVLHSWGRPELVVVVAQADGALVAWAEDRGRLSRWEPGGTIAREMLRPGSSGWLRRSAWQVRRLGNACSRHPCAGNSGQPTLADFPSH